VGGGAHTASDVERMIRHVDADKFLRMYNQGRLHVKSCSEEDFLQVVVVPAGFEAFVFQADFGRPFVLEEAQRGPA
jgi:hypothetical protein